MGRGLHQGFVLRNWKDKLPSNDMTEVEGRAGCKRGGPWHVGWGLEISSVLDMPRLRCQLEMSF